MSDERYNGKDIRLITCLISIRVHLEVMQRLELRVRTHYSAVKQLLISLFKILNQL